ncbi:hypothetical protein [Mesorhizobium sp. IMUNJ 23232]|uniref:hypothetical protein n=1 Tax=Mesorhizobium sp. IMUNJ 23232 TaxID=3376064 RepID=UPI0037ACE7E3
MRAKILLGSLACLALTACQSVLGFDTTSHEVMASSGLYRVFEHPKGDRIMTKPSPAGIVTAMPGYSSYTYQAASDQAEAARRYLDETGRSNCPIVFVREIAGPQFEYRFNCLVP